MFPKLFETLNAVMETGKVAAVTGELSFKDSDEAGEDGEPRREGKILVKRAVPVSENGKQPLSGYDKAEINASDAGSSGKYTVSFSRYGTAERMSAPHSSSAPARAPGTGALSAAALPPAKDSEGKTLCLYLKLPGADSPAFARVRRLLEIFAYGRTPVFLHFADSGKTVRLAGGDLYLNRTALDLLAEILGEDCVKTAYRQI